MSGIFSTCLAQRIHLAFATLDSPGNHFWNCIFFYIFCERKKQSKKYFVASLNCFVYSVSLYMSNHNLVNKVRISIYSLNSIGLSTAILKFYFGLLHLLDWISIWFIYLLKRSVKYRKYLSNHNFVKSRQIYNPIIAFIRLFFCLPEHKLRIAIFALLDKYIMHFIRQMFFFYV